jgi:hypothetical protein
MLPSPINAPLFSVRALEELNDQYETKETPVGRLGYSHRDDGFHVFADPIIGKIYSEL